MQGVSTPPLHPLCSSLLTWSLQVSHSGRHCFPFISVEGPDVQAKVYNCSHDYICKAMPVFSSITAGFAFVGVPASFI